MNCLNCSAPLDWDGYRPILVCEFCRSIRSIPTTNDSRDRTVNLDQPGDSNCPRCHERMTVAALDGRKVEHCEECGGVLIANAQFADVVRSRRAKFRGAPSQPAPLDVEQLKIGINCPRCQQEMEVHPYYGPGNVVIDSCTECRLLWLDCGEMAAIELAPGLR